MKWGFRNSLIHITSHSTYTHVLYSFYYHTSYISNISLILSLVFRFLNAKKKKINRLQLSYFKNMRKNSHHGLVFFFVFFPILVWPYCRTRSECWEGNRIKLRDRCMWREVNSSAERGRCCLEDKFSLKEIRHGQSALRWAGEEVIEVRMAELSGQELLCLKKKIQKRSRNMSQSII